MTDETKKYLAIGFTVVSVAIAGFIFYRTIFGGNSAPAANADVALYCTDCGGFEIEVEQYREILSKNPESMMMPMMPAQQKPMECPKCGKEACYPAQKCLECEAIYVFGQSKDKEYPDRCPDCGFSQMEDYN